MATIENSLQILGVGGTFLALSLYLGNLWIKNFGHDIANTTETKYFLVTPKLIEISKVLIGSSFNLETIRLINNGTIDVISGIVLVISYSTDVDGLTKFDLKTRSGDIFTFINSEKLLKQEINKINGLENIEICLKNIASAIQDCFSPERIALRAIGNLDLLNRSRIIRINNLNTYRNELTEAFNYGQSITCIYNRVEGEISALQIQSKEIKKLTLEKQLQTPSIDQEPDDHIPLPIDLEFVGNFSENQKLAFRQATQRWGSIIRGDLPPATINGKRIEGISITARALEIDGPHNRLAQASPIHLRPDSLLPATGIMEFDSVDLKLIEENGSLLNVIIHEMAHVLGFGSLWERKGLLQDIGTDNPTFIGKNVMREYAKLIGENQLVPVPIENMGRQGTQYGHWRESIFGNELMTGYIDNGPNPFSRMTIASFQDLGYSCNFASADLYKIPNKCHTNRSGISKNTSCCCKNHN